MDRAHAGLWLFEAQVQESLLRPEGKVNESLLQRWPMAMWRPSCHPGGTHDLSSLVMAYGSLRNGGGYFHPESFVLCSYFGNTHFIVSLIVLFGERDILLVWSLIVTQRKIFGICSMNSKIMLEKLLRWTPLLDIHYRILNETCVFDLPFRIKQTSFMFHIIH